MSIKPSASAEVRTLVATLADPDPVKRESAIARLAVIGSRSVDRLLAAYTAPATNDETRLAILRVFDAIPDPRTLPVIRLALTRPPELAIAAVNALRGLLDDPSDDTATEALDLLVAIVVDPAADRSLRLAAHDALRGMPEDVQTRLASALASDPDPVIRARLAAPGDERAPAQVEWLEALAGRMGRDPGALQAGARLNADTAPLGDLHRMIDEARARERECQGSAAADEWREFRGQLHLALARRGSTVALVDLRETFVDARSVPPETFVAALRAIGDESCLEPIASAYSRIEEARARTGLASAWAGIVTREKISVRHPAMKRVTARWPGAVESLSTISRTTPRPTTRRRT